MSLSKFTTLARRIIAVLFWPALALVVWGELTSHGPSLETHVWDKLLHFTAYFGLALIATLAVRADRRIWWILLALIVLGGVLEIVQGMVGRDADFHDEIANSIGALTGALLGWALVSLHARLVGRRLRSYFPAAMKTTLLQEFKKFAMRGSVIDLSIGVIIGAAFTGIVNSLVKDIMTPPLGMLLGGLDFSNFFITLKGGTHFNTLADAQKAGAVTINYGAFINTLFNFLVVAIAMFLVVRSVNRLRALPPAEETPPLAPPEELLVLREIRDALKERP